jgi:hypothetical protein
MSYPEGEDGAQRGSPLCDSCHRPTDFVTTIPRVTEPGRVHMFQCGTCGKLKFLDEVDR